MRLGFTLVPILFGAEKFAHVTVNRDKYLAPDVQRWFSPFDTVHQTMYVVAAVEIFAGIVVVLLRARRTAGGTRPSGVALQSSRPADPAAPHQRRRPLRRPPQTDRAATVAPTRRLARRLQPVPRAHRASPLRRWNLARRRNPSPRRPERLLALHDHGTDFAKSRHLVRMTAASDTQERTETHIDASSRRRRS
jgi:hypothetical protein